MMRDKPHPISLWKWLEQAVAAGRVKRDGEGRPYNTIPLLARRSSIHHL